MGKLTLPVSVRISENEKSERLYRLESQRDKAIEAAAQELGKYLEIPRGEYWEDMLPTALLALLHAQYRQASIKAAVAFLRSRGFTVEGPSDDPVWQFV